MENKAARILLVEDEPNFGTVLKSYLELAGYEVDHCENGFVGLSHFRREKFDLCILDVMMPEKDGFELAKEIRERDKEIPLVFLTARNQKQDQIKGFSLGADDYLCKPFDSEVLIWKVRALLRSKQTSDPSSEDLLFADQLTIGHSVYVPRSRELIYEDQTHRLTPKEHELLLLLHRYKDSVLPRSIALNQIWGEESYFTKRSMDVYIARLRKLLKHEPSVHIENIHSEGYRMLIIHDI